MSKQETMQYLDREGITATAVNHPDTPKKWVLEWLEKFDGHNLTMDLAEFKAYYREYILEKFK